MPRALSVEGPGGKVARSEWNEAIRPCIGDRRPGKTGEAKAGFASARPADRPATILTGRPGLPNRASLTDRTYPASPIPRAIPDAANTMTITSTACQWPIRT